MRVRELIQQLSLIKKHGENNPLIEIYQKHIQEEHQTPTEEQEQS